MRCYLMRHADALSADLSPDPPISKKGIEETERVAQFIQNAPIDEIWVSVKKRAYETGEIVAKNVFVSLVTTEGLKPSDPVEPIADKIESSKKNLLLVSHIPFVPKLLGYLLLRNPTATLVDFSGSSIVCLEKKGGVWQIVWVVSPELKYGAKDSNSS